MTFASRVLGFFCLDFDFAFDLRTAAFSPITERVYVGSRPTLDDVPALAEAGITHVVSCLEEPALSTMSFLDLSFETLRLPLRDSMDEDIAATFPTFTRFAEQTAVVLVHCQVGVSRSATLATAHLMQAERLTFWDAVSHVRQKRPGILPNIGFASQLQRLEHALFPEVRPELSSLARYLREIANAPVDIEVLQEVLVQHDFDAPRALRAIFGGEIPRVVQGARA
ncbi:MAG: dual specificity protein phosphatase [Myxococcota bacterium]